MQFPFLFCRKALFGSNLSNMMKLTTCGHSASSWRLTVAMVSVLIWFLRPCLSELFILLNVILPTTMRCCLLIAKRPSLGLAGMTVTCDSCCVTWSAPNLGYFIFVGCTWHLKHIRNFCWLWMRWIGHKTNASARAPVLSKVKCLYLKKHFLQFWFICTILNRNGFSCIFSHLFLKSVFQVIYSTWWNIERFFWLC